MKDARAQSGFSDYVPLVADVRNYLVAKKGGNRPPYGGRFSKLTSRAFKRINKIEEGEKTDVAKEFDIAHSVVSRLWKSFKTTGMCSRRHGGGRVRSTTPAENRYIVLSAKRNRRTTAQQHRTARLQWCREHHNWTEQDWTCILFSDESRFSLSSDCRRQLIWRESGTAYRPENIQEKDRCPTCSIMVWAGIMINGRTLLHVVANGTMTDQ
ncbi:transposable element Tcb2 transposase [Trichonephila clavipes]|nr:transposable element Tcb2 transposase [Trichonephila clavipes]